METRANYVLIGAFTVLTAVFLLLFALWAAKFSSDRDWDRYEVIFSEPVTGLTEGGSVQYNGIGVGTVDRLSLDPDDARNVIALLKLKADTPVKVDTRAKLSQQGITGVPFIQLTGGSPQAALLEPNDNDDIPIIRTEPSALQNIADTANRLVARMDELLSEQNIERISTTLENLQQATGSIAGVLVPTILVFFFIYTPWEAWVVVKYMPVSPNWAHVSSQGVQEIAMPCNHAIPRVILHEPSVR